MKLYRDCISLLLLFTMHYHCEGQKIITVTKEQEQSIPISQICDKVIPLKLKNTDIPISEIAKNITVDKDNLFLYDSGRKVILRFNLKGEFLNTIGHTGKGPGEYTYGSGFTIDAVKKHVFFLTTSGLLQFDYNGNFLSQHKNIKGERIQFISNKLYISYSDSKTNFKTAPPSIEFTRKISILDSYCKSFNNVVVRHYKVKGQRPNLRVFKHSYPIGQVNNKIFIYIPENFGVITSIYDTLYTLNNDKELIPWLKLDFGKIHQQDGQTEVVVENICLTKRFVFCNYQWEFKYKGKYIFLYDQKNNIGFSSKEYNDDIYHTGQADLFPIDTSNDLFYFVKNAYELVGKIDGITEEDNPVIFLVQLKK